VNGSLKEKEVRRLLSRAWVRRRTLWPPLCGLGYIFQRANRPNVVMSPRGDFSLDLAPVANDWPLFAGSPRAASGCCRSLVQETPSLGLKAKTK
jgi:hypothetical protein